MREIIRSWATLNRLERAGYTSLGGLIIVLMLGRMTIGYFVHPPAPDPAKEKALADAWATFAATHPETEEDTYRSKAKEFAPDLTAQPFPFDPNTLDSAGFRKLGLSARATKGLMGWRRGGMVFRKPEDFSRLYNLPPDQYQKLRPFILIDPAVAAGRGRPHSSGFPGWKTAYQPAPATVDLNTVDSATLVRLPAIGPTLARKLIAHRNALGGFLDHGQLMEVYRFPDSTMLMLRERLIIRPEAIRKLSLNKSSADQLARHPYIGEKMAANIILLREGLKGFTTLTQLRQVPMMNAENYRRLLPYCVTD